MTDYKDTLNLPKTGFPMKANLAQREPGMLAQWQKEGIYKKIRSSRSGREKWILHDGPPYANGDIHLGHALNKILKDIIVKSHTLDGYDCPYVPGWDCHGLPIEHKVETKIGKAGTKVDYVTFRQKCREYALRQVDGQRKDFIRLGVFGDWENPYLTINYQTEADIVRALGKIIENGHLVRGFKPVYWSVVGGSALAEAEVEYQDKTSYSIDVRFKVAEEDKVLGQIGGGAGLGRLSTVIWTTTPWTLPANQAVSLHPELEYVVLSLDLGLGQERVIVASELCETALSRWGVADYEILHRFQGAALEGVQLQHPFYDRLVPVILGEHVTTEAGTGAVHTAPDHGVDDFNVGQKYGLGTLNLIGDDGVFNSKTELFAGQHVYKVDVPVIDELKRSNALVAESQLVHSFPHCWRTKTPLIYRATPQWFISMTQNNLMGDVKEAVDNVSWTPDWGKARMQSMLDSSPDWCISRQRTWGVPITLFIHKETQELHPRTLALIEAVAAKIETEGMDAWFESSAEDWLGDEQTEYQKVTDTLDVWFDSGVTHFSVLGRREELAYPADLYLEGSDQHRGWFQSSLKTAMAMNGTPPYRQVLTHGFTVDAQGRKQSKSLGNVISPQKVINESGADVLRLWVAATDFSSEMSCTADILKQVADSYRRIRNTARYFLSSLSDFTPEQHTVPMEDLVALDRWAILRAADLQVDIRNAYDEYQFHIIYQKLHNFCVNDMGGFYLDILKDRLYTVKADALARRSAQTALHHLCEVFVRWISPILSFTAEEIWQHMPGERASTVFVEEWQETPVAQVNSETLSLDYWQQIMDIKVEVNKSLEQARKNGEIGSSLEADVELFCTTEVAQILEKAGEELRFLLITSTAILSVSEPPPEAKATDITGLSLRVRASEQSKCARCWHHTDTVGSVEAHPELCGRCVINVDGDGELRAYA